MSEDKKGDEAEEAGKDDPIFGMPEGIAPPPMPKPDLHSIVEEGPTYGKSGGDGGKSKKEKRKKKNSEPEGYRHPLDSVAAPGQQPKQARKGCCGCIAGIFAFFILISIAITVVVGWFGPARPILDGYEIVNHTGEETVVISTAPEGPTYYFGNELVYEPAVTDVPVAFAGRLVMLGGEFREPVTAAAAKVVGTERASFAKDLSIWAGEFVDEGVQLSGELRGRVFQNTEAE